MREIENTFVIVRSAAERTTDGCLALLKLIFPEENICVINVAPFSKAIKEMFEMGLRQKKDWLFSVDADVLVSEAGVKKLFDRASTISANTFQIQGLVLDKFFSVYRPAGNHLYRTAFAEKAISLIPDEGTSLRPETDMLNRMSEAGYSWIQCDALVGIHDYEQYYADIYRKCFLQAHKHSWLLSDAEKYWNEIAVKDTDFQVAIWGALSGKLYSDTVYVDKRFLEKEVNDVLLIKQIKEKRTFDTSSLHDYVQSVLNTYPKQKHIDFQNKMFTESKWNHTFNLSNDNSEKQKLRSHKKGFLDKVIYKIGSIFVKIGKKLQFVGSS